MASAWVIGVVVFPISLLIVKDNLFLRVEIALIVTVFTTSLLMFVLLKKALSKQSITNEIKN